MKSKPKFDKKKCLKCKYHSCRGSLGYPVRVGKKTYSVYCDFICQTGISPLKPGPNKTVTDLRGEDYNNCQLFKEGEPEKRTEPIALKGSIRR